MSRKKADENIIHFPENEKEIELNFDLPNPAEMVMLMLHHPNFLELPQVTDGLYYLNPDAGNLYCECNEQAIDDFLRLCKKQKKNVVEALCIPVIDEDGDMEFASFWEQFLSSCLVKHIASCIQFQLYNEEETREMYDFVIENLEEIVSSLDEQGYIALCLDALNDIYSDKENMEVLVSLFDDDEEDDEE